jgi:hypothetical protein
MENDFEPLLIKCLKECANRRWGLFGQNQQPESAAALHGPEAERLRELAEEIRELRTQFGQSNAMSERFLHCCSERSDSELRPQVRELLEQSIARGRAATKARARKLLKELKAE